jgi:hypothetical protein
MQQVIALDIWNHYCDTLARSGISLDRFICSGRNKQPIGGPGWQDRHISRETGTQRLKAGENVALLTGPNNPGLVIVDTDGPEADQWFRDQLDDFQGLAYRKGGKGKHYYFRLAPGQQVSKSRIQLHEGIDILGNGSNGNAICPGSTRHPGPKDPEDSKPVIYDWTVTTLDGCIPLLPEALLAALMDATRKKPRASQKEPHQGAIQWPQARTIATFRKKLSADSPASKMTDGRDNYLVSLAGVVRQRYAATYEQILEVLKDENTNFSISHPEGPLPIAELERKAKTVSEYQASEPEKYTFVTAAQDTLERLEDNERLVFDLVTENFYQHQAGVYVEKSKKEINFAIQDTLDALGMPAIGKASFLNDAITRLAKITASKPKLNTWMDESRPGSFIVLQDCILDVQAYIDARAILEPDEMQDSSFLETMGVVQWRIPHTPDYFTLTKLPFALDEEASCPLWTRHLATLLPDADTRKELQKFIGLCLVYDTSYQKAAILLGEGGAGKGTVLRTIEMLVGSANRSAVSLQDISEKFSAIEMFGKLVNFDGDTKADVFDEAIFKKVTGEDQIVWQQKYSKAFSAESTARWIISANKMPSITDKSKGVWRRLLLFKVESPSYSAPDTQLQGKLAKELPGIFNWAIQGLAMLYAEGFNPSAKMLAELNEQRTNNNNVALWVEEKCEEDASGSVSRATAYENYTSFTISNGFKPLNITNFKQALDSMGYKTYRSNTGGTREERISGIRMAMY